jgi:branched-chain amino acid transport system permease protein
MGAVLEQLPQVAVSGLTLGSIYALVALGFVTIYNVTKVINFAQGDFVMLGALLTVTLAARMPLYLAVPAAVAATALAGLLVQRLALAPARGASELALVIITIGVSTAMRGGALLVWGTDPVPLEAFSRGGEIGLGPVVISRQALWVLGTAALSVTLLRLFFSRSVMGQALRACAVNPMAARLMGIRPDRMSQLSFVIGAGLAALGGAVMAPITFASYDMGLGLGLKGFVAAIVGGLVSPVGAVLGGLLLGILESVAGSVKSALTDITAFVVLLAVLLGTKVQPLGMSEREIDAGGI